MQHCPHCFLLCGTWTGKLPFEGAPPDGDGLPDLHLALYNAVIVFDQATKLAYCCAWVHLGAHGGDVAAAYAAGKRALAAMTERIRPSRTPNLPLGKVLWPQACSFWPFKSWSCMQPKR